MLNLASKATMHKMIVLLSQLMIKAQANQLMIIVSNSTHYSKILVIPKATQQHLQALLAMLLLVASVFATAHTCITLHAIQLWRNAEMFRSIVIKNAASMFQNTTNKPIAVMYLSTTHKPTAAKCLNTTTHANAYSAHNTTANNSAPTNLATTTKKNAIQKNAANKHHC